MTAPTIPNLSPVRSTHPAILPRPAWQARLRRGVRFVAQVATVIAYTTPITFSLALGWLIANLLGVIR